MASETLVYSYLVTNYNNPGQLSRIVWSLLLEVLFNGLTALLVQSFLVLRIWRLSSGNAWLSGAALFLVLGEFGCVVAFVTLSLPLQTFDDLRRLKTLSITVNGLAAAGDILIAGILSKLLYGSRTGLQRSVIHSVSAEDIFEVMYVSSDTLIRKLVIWSVNTGLITVKVGLSSSPGQPVYHAHPHTKAFVQSHPLPRHIIIAGNTFLYILFFFCIGHLYCNSLLATLNARNMMRGATCGVHTISHSHREPQAMNTTLSFPAESFGPLRSAQTQKAPTKLGSNQEGWTQGRSDSLSAPYAAVP
ncbi:hypothetical protein C8F01DRAFT_1264850 [Mycena amicta]|nr:hypothetical protein C8F01DRAFT_1264850 [Mycena amicta]